MKLKVLLEKLKVKMWNFLRRYDEKSFDCLKKINRGNEKSHT